MSALQRHIRVALTGFVAAFVCACATSSVATRTRAIGDADAQAKRALADERNFQAGSISPRAIAVIPFATPANDTLLRPLSFSLADLLATDLATSDKMKLVERTQMDAMLRELSLVESGAVDPGTAPRVGRLVGARRLIIGRVAMNGPDQVVLSASVVDVIDGSVAVLVNATAPLAKVIGAEDELALRVFQELGIVLTPAQRAKVQMQNTTQLATLVAYGRGLQSEARGDAAGAAQHYGEAAKLDSRFVADRNQASASRGGASSGVQRALALGVQGVNNLGTVRVADAADTPLISSSLLTLVLTIHITP